jgi:hypothetical protein
MADQPKAMGIPKIMSYEDYDVLQGVPEATREEWKVGTFHNSEMNGDDVIFKVKAAVMEASPEELETDAEFTETSGDKSEDANTKEEAIGAAKLQARPMK